MAPQCSLYSISLVCCVCLVVLLEQYLCRLCMLSSFRRLVGAWKYLLWLRHWPAGLEWLQAENPSACGDTLLILLIPFVQGQNGLWKVWLGMCCRRPKYLNGAIVHPIEMEGDINNGTHSIFNPRERSRRTPVVSQPSLVSLYLSFVTHKLFNQPSVVFRSNSF